MPEETLTRRDVVHPAEFVQADAVVSVGLRELRWLGKTYGPKVPQCRQNLEAGDLIDRVRGAGADPGEQPQESVLFRTVRDHFESFAAEWRGSDDSDHGLPKYVEDDFRDYLSCGDLALRLRCDSCRKDLLLPFSCKHHTACASCAARRMESIAAHLVDHVPPSGPAGAQNPLAYPTPRRRYSMRSTIFPRARRERSTVRTVSRMTRREGTVLR
jgi:hypothetical protein